MCSFGVRQLSLYKLLNADSLVKPTKKPLDPVVKIGITVLVGGFILIGGGMYISRPDRSIPPFSIGSQQATTVLIHVPAWTSDPEIESLIRRFRKLGKESHDFRAMKIKPTTPNDPNGFYQEVMLYIFSDPGWTEPDKLERYLRSREAPEGMGFARDFIAAARGGFVYREGSMAGWLGPIPETKEKLEEQNIQVLFDERIHGSYSKEPLKK